MGNIFYPEVFAGTNHFQKVDNTLKINTVEEDANIEGANISVRSNRCLTIRLSSEQLSLNRFTVHQILTDMRKVGAKMMPKNTHKCGGQSKKEVS